jgi:hypothetical protein
VGNATSWPLCPRGRAVPWLRRLAASLSPRRPRFDPGSVHVGFVMGKVALGQVFPCQFHSTGAPLLEKGQKNNNHHRHLHHSVAQEASRLRCVRSVCCGAFTITKTTPGEDTLYPLYKRTDGSQGRSERVRKISLPPGFDPWTVQHVGVAILTSLSQPTCGPGCLFNVTLECGLNIHNSRHATDTPFVQPKSEHALWSERSRPKQGTNDSHGNPKMCWRQNGCEDMVCDSCCTQMAKVGYD